jgi:zinc ribbon protein
MSMRVTESRPRFCPRCGAGAVAGMPFCPQCGFDLAGAPPAATVAPAADAPPHPAEPKSTAIVLAPPSRVERSLPRAAERVRAVGSVPPVVLAGLLIMIGLIAYGLLSRPAASPSSPAGGFGPGATAGSAPGASALITGLTILSPSDGQSVATKDVNIIGSAPPGVSVTQDISFGLDQHGQSDGTGHWAIKVSLNEGENKLTFRIGDDSSTKKTIRIIYTPPAP